MGLKYRKRIRIIGGVYLTVSRTGVSLTVGNRLVKLNVGKRGFNVTGSAPGTGFSYQQPLSWTRLNGWIKRSEARGPEDAETPGKARKNHSRSLLAVEPIHQTNKPVAMTNTASTPKKPGCLSIVICPFTINYTLAWQFWKAH